MDNSTQLKVGVFLHNGTYRIERTLTQGGFGITYLAYDIKHDRLVAIKEYYKKEWHNRDETTSYVTTNDDSAELEGMFRKKFAKEAHTIMRLNHPNIVKVFEFFEENGTLYYSMEYIEGDSLSNIVKSRGAFSEGEAISLIKTVASTLAYIHSQNELHLDVTPRNIMIDNTGRVILIDFGVSKHYNEKGEQSTATPVARSEGYAPKEQYLSEGVIKFSPATDIYALSATFYFILTATTPPNVNDRQHCLEEDRELLNIPASLSDNVRNAIKWGMNISRNERLQNADEFIGSLSGQFHKREIKVITVTSETYAGERKILETLKKNGQYKEAYNLCMDWIQKGVEVEYAKNECNELLPLLSIASKKDKKRTKFFIVFVVIVIILSMLITLLISIAN